ncbi:MAG: glycoside hydrolase family 127 protein [Verrucomicrobiota bacterium]
MKSMPLALICLAIALLPGSRQSAAADPRPFRVPSALPDALELPSPSAVHLEGFLGARVSANEKNRLVKVELEPLLAGFRHKPGTHPWIGEHIGKWMHAATLAWANSDDDALRAKLDYAASELVKAQESDGYLGTYVPEKRFGLFEGSDWDVWSHKYNLMGLLTYYQFTGNDAALQACRKMGDLLIATFGPGKKSILSAGTHVGMAATSVLEPVVLLYRLTGEDRYLGFAKYLVASWGEANGPQVLKTLLDQKNVQKTANGKAYEMLSNLVGLCELARVTGERAYLQAALNAWEDVVTHRLYLTGSASQGEHFRDDYYLPNQESAHVAETCVTTTWIQLNSQLLRLTGEARFGSELERTFYNHLSAAQRPDGAQWCYFTALEGKKPYGPGINCCVSSGPRGMALVPLHAWLRSPDLAKGGPALNLLESSKFTFAVQDSPATLEFASEFPRAGRGTLTFRLRRPCPLGLRVREPAWAAPLRVAQNGQAIPLEKDAKGWAIIAEREWKDGDQLTFSFDLEGRMVLGDHGNKDRAALAWGPFVLAYDSQQNPGLPAPRSVGLAEAGGAPVLHLKAGQELAWEGKIRAAKDAEAAAATFVAFADAGRADSTYRVWLRAPGVPIPSHASLLAAGEESRSRPGNVDGSINDGDPASFVVTYNGRKAAEDWFAITLDQPTTIRRVVYIPGKVFHDGGWFDASGGKPRIQVRRNKTARWETVATLAEYPATSASDPRGLKDPSEHGFTIRLAQPIEVLAVRVAGTPASGDSPQQAFSSCAELSAFAD